MILHGGWKDLTLLMFSYRRQTRQTEIWKPINPVKIQFDVLQGKKSYGCHPLWPI